ncbi:probable receptor-like protein kinase At5g20050 [Aristolochia californica]|uniref:probable receptor-like protein kinase At5g20050 n=1 Tax=Aristolochia californica TaxID=171875 RepID=UPI0035DC5869
MTSGEKGNNHVLITFIFFSFLYSIQSAKSPSYYYEQCAPTVCGNSVIQFPIGLKPLCRSAYISTSCENDSVYITEDKPRRTKYKVLDTMNSSVYARGYFMLVDISLLGCAPIPPFLDQDWQIWFMSGNFLMRTDYKRGTFFNCSQTPGADLLARLSEAPCLECGNTSNLCYFYDGYMDQIPNCQPLRVSIPNSLVNNFTGVGNLRTKLQEGFKVNWESPCGVECMSNNGGRCGFVDENRNKGDEVCFCNSTVHQTSCSDGIIISLAGVKSNKKIMIAGLGIGIAIVVMGVCYAYVRRRKQMRKKVELRGQDEQALRRYLDNKNVPASMETFLENYAYGMPSRFSYKQIKKYTNNFTDKLGQGGFGSVFKATLPNGFTVAVKLLDETEQSETQFLNEVRTVGQIHHNNLVRLLGFCFQQSKRALVYEFMENGSLEKHIHRKNKPPLERLSWSQLHDIALGTARGIAYLHEECRSRILHCDIKPHNILLDRKFQPKVSDFGLAQLMNREHSHVTVSGGRGTPGYAPPEMWWKNYGGITEKSDVYSFGMVLLEMVGGRRNFDADASKASEVYFPEWVYRHHVLHNGTGSPSRNDSNSNSSSSRSAGSKWQMCEREEEEGMARKMELVGLWCIQFSPAKRPGMRKVVEMLEGILEGIAVIEEPPVPFDAAVSQLGRPM